MDWVEIMAQLVYIAVNKDYAPDEVWENFESFKKAYRDLFGRDFGGGK